MTKTPLIPQGSALWPIDVTASSNPTPVDRRTEILANPGFAKYPTDHMVHATWTADAGWHGAELVPYGPLVFDPTTNFLHYGQAIFEGMKATLGKNSVPLLFRPDENAKRLNHSADRM
jgi:branched-chain amino acid aminotransferase